MNIEANPIRCSNNRMKIWYRICTLNLHNNMDICIAACTIGLKFQGGKYKNREFFFLSETGIRTEIFNKSQVSISYDGGVKFTLKIIFQLMNHLGSLHKRNSIEINLVVHSKLDIFPVLVCRNNKKGRQKFEIYIIFLMKQTQTDEGK